MNRNEIKTTLQRIAKRRNVELDGLLLRDYVEEIDEMLRTERSNADEDAEDAADNAADDIIAAIDAYIYNIEIDDKNRSEIMQLLDGIASGLSNLPCYNTDNKINLLKLKLY